MVLGEEPMCIIFIGLHYVVIVLIGEKNCGGACD